MLRPLTVLLLVAAAAAAQSDDEVVLKHERPLQYGPYVHLIESKEKAAVTVRVKKMFGGLRNLFRACPTCKRKGTVRETVREGYWLDQWTWVPAVYNYRTCPTCKGERDLFRANDAARAFTTYSRRESDPRGGFNVARDRFVARLKSAGFNYRKPPRFRVEVHGRFATVYGGRSNHVFPLKLELLPDGKKYTWFLHSPEINGAFGDRLSASGAAEIAGAVAGDILVLSDGTPVRLCGIAVPGANGKLPPTDLSTPDEALRKLTEKELAGRTVKLVPDKYNKLTCQGLPLVFVEFEGKDFAETLLLRGLVRRHPRHGHARRNRYNKAEAQAKREKVGIWSR